MHTALYFGSFNPLHHGHIGIAEYVMQHCDIDRFVMVLSPHNPFKKAENLEEPAKRLSDLRTAIEKINAQPSAEKSHSGIQSTASKGYNSLPCNKIEISDIEFKMSEPLYTLRTLETLQKQHPDTEFVIVVGSDSYEAMPTWYHGEEILKRWKTIVYPRKGADRKKIMEMCALYGDEYLEDAPLFDISSTQIRSGEIKQ